MHTFVLVNAEGRETLVKFHWKPTCGECLAAVSMQEEGPAGGWVLVLAGQPARLPWPTPAPLTTDPAGVQFLLEGQAVPQWLLLSSAASHAFVPLPYLV